MYLIKFRPTFMSWVCGIGFAIGAAMSFGVTMSMAKSARILEGARYVAMGSSYAAGPGVTTSADAPGNRCQRSADNYAHQLARKRRLVLVDVSCGGATTAHILGPWGELPAQLDAVTPDTDLVTVTIGGNDVGFAAGLIVGSCPKVPLPATAPSMCKAVLAMRASNPQARIPLLEPPTEAVWQRLDLALVQIAREVHRRAPRARLIFVDYVRVLGDSPLCEITPLSPEAANRARSISARLAILTANAAQRGDAGLIRASAMSRGHEACAAVPWVTGFIASDRPANFTPYHPNLEAMTAIAQALDTQFNR